MPTPTAIARTAGTSSAIRSALRTDMPADMPTFSKSSATMNL